MDPPLGFLLSRRTERLAVQDRCGEKLAYQGLNASTTQMATALNATHFGWSITWCGENIASRIFDISHLPRRVEREPLAGPSKVGMVSAQRKLITNFSGGCHTASYFIQ